MAKITLYGLYNVTFIFYLVRDPHRWRGSHRVRKSTGWTLASTLTYGMQCIPIADQNNNKKNFISTSDFLKFGSIKCTADLKLLRHFEVIFCGGRVRSVGAFANLRKVTISFVTSVSMEQLGCHWTDFHERLYSSIFRSCRENSSFINP